MKEPTPGSAVVCPPSAPGVDYPLLHRWFVQYNPAYFVSALCLLAGIYLISDGLGRPEQRSGEIWLLGIVQLYEVLLIAGAAFLYRGLGQRRPAVILALVEMVYLFDPTFQTEVAAYLERPGQIAAFVWLAGFAVKLTALAWALRLRVPTRVVVLAAAGAAAVALLPQLFYARILDRHGMTLVIAWVGFTLGVAGSWLRPSLTSSDQLDEWGRLVLRRAACGTAAVWSGLLLCHAGFWALANDLDFGPLLFAVPLLLLVARLGREVDTWLGVAVALGIAIAIDPAALSTVAAMAAMVLAARARGGYLVGRAPIADPVDDTSDHPYRSRAVGAPATPPPIAVACPRLYVGAITCATLAVWTAGWHHAPLPPHLLWLDLIASVGLLWLLFYRHLASAAIPLLLLHGHHAVRADLVPATRGQWGVVLVVAAFLLLFGGVAASCRRQSDSPGESEPG